LALLFLLLFAQGEIPGLGGQRQRNFLGEDAVVVERARTRWPDVLNDNGAVSAAALSFDTNGVVFGGGVDYAWTNNIIVGAEYLHYAFGDDKRLLPVAVIGPNPRDFINLKSVDVVRVRASYR
jgi:opacity protein-like surface antigen